MQDVIEDERRRVERDERRRLRIVSQTRNAPRNPVAGFWLGIAGAVSFAAGFVCWLFPRYVWSAMVDVGMAPRPQHDDGLVETVWTFLQIAGAAPWLCLFGVLLFIGGRIIAARGAR